MRMRVWKERERARGLAWIDYDENGSVPCVIGGRKMFVGVVGVLNQ